MKNSHLTISSIKRLRQMLTAGAEARLIGNELKMSFHILRIEANDVGCVTHLSAVKQRAGNVGFVEVVDPKFKGQTSMYNCMKFVQFNGRIIGVVAIQMHGILRFFRRDSLFTRSAIFAVDDNLNKDEQEVLYEEHDRLLNIQGSNWLYWNKGAIVELPTYVTAPQAFF